MRETRSGRRQAPTRQSANSRGEPVVDRAPRVEIRGSRHLSLPTTPVRVLPLRLPVIA